MSVIMQPVSIRHSDFNTALIIFPSSMFCWDESTYPFLLPLFPPVFKARVNSGCSLSEMFFWVLTSENTCFKFANCWKYTLVVWGAGGIDWAEGGEVSLACVPGTSHEHIIPCGALCCCNRASWNVVQHSCRHSTIAKNHYRQNSSASYWEDILLHKFEKPNT